MLRVSEALAALALQCALWSHVRLHQPRRPQSLVIDRTLHTSVPRATDTIKWGRDRAVLRLVLVATAETQLHDCLDMNVQCLQLLPDDALRHSSAQVLHQEAHTMVFWERKGVETHTLTSLRDRNALTMALKPLAFDGTTISFSAFSWAVRPPGHENPQPCQEGTDVSDT